MPDEAAGCLFLIFEFLLNLFTCGGRVNRKAALIIAIVVIVLVGKVIWDSTR